LLAHTLTFKIIQKSDGGNASLATIGGIGADPS